MPLAARKMDRISKGITNEDDNHDDDCIRLNLEIDKDTIRPVLSHIKRQIMNVIHQQLKRTDIQLISQNCFSSEDVVPLTSAQWSEENLVARIPLLKSLVSSSCFDEIKQRHIMSAFSIFDFIPLTLSAEVLENEEVEKTSTVFLKCTVDQKVVQFFETLINLRHACETTLATTGKKSFQLKRYAEPVSLPIFYIDTKHVNKCADKIKEVTDDLANSLVITGRLLSLTYKTNRLQPQTATNDQQSISFCSSTSEDTESLANLSIKPGYQVQRKIQERSDTARSVLTDRMWYTKTKGASEHAMCVARAALLEVSDRMKKDDNFDDADVETHLKDFRAELESTFERSLKQPGLDYEALVESEVENLRNRSAENAARCIDNAIEQTPAGSQVQEALNQRRSLLSGAEEIEFMTRALPNHFALGQQHDDFLRENFVKLAYYDQKICDEGSLIRNMIVALETCKMDTYANCRQVAQQLTLSFSRIKYLFDSLENRSDRHSLVSTHHGTTLTAKERSDVEGSDRASVGSHSSGKISFLHNFEGIQASTPVPSIISNASVNSGNNGHPPGVENQKLKVQSAPLPFQDNNNKNAKQQEVNSSLQTVTTSVATTVATASTTTANTTPPAGPVRSDLITPAHAMNLRSKSRDNVSDPKKK